MCFHFGLLPRIIPLPEEGTTSLNSRQNLCRVIASLRILDYSVMTLLVIHQQANAAVCHQGRPGFLGIRYTGAF